MNELIIFVNADIINYLIYHTKAMLTDKDKRIKEFFGFDLHTVPLSIVSVLSLWCSWGSPHLTRSDDSFNLVSIGKKRKTHTAE